VHNTEYTHLPPLNSPPVFEIPWLCVFRPVVRAPLFSISNYNAIRAHSAPNNTVLANLLHLVSFFFISLCSKAIQVARFYARPMSRFLLIASRRAALISHYLLRFARVFE
jgi:hypothetical protein